MDPLIHLSPNHLSCSKDYLDYSFYCENIDLYEELYTRGSNLINEAKQKFLKEYPLPLKSKEDLENRLDELFKRKKRCIDFNSPQFDIEITDRKIAETARLLQNNEYLRTGPEYEYAKEHLIKSDEWYNEVFLPLVKKIKEYNEKKYYEWKFSVFDEKGFKEWKDSVIMKKMELDEEFETEG